MAEKKIQENPLPEAQAELAKKDMTVKPSDKGMTVPIPAAAEIQPPAYTKTAPNDLYRRLLPAVLFLLTFVTVMTMLLIYMDTVALGAQQFRLNMSRDYELSRIPASSPQLVAFVRQLHLRPRARDVASPGERTARVDAVDRVFTGAQDNLTFVEIFPRGARDATTLYLQGRGWRGVVLRAAARDYLGLRGGAAALHACLSHTEHPREVTYHESDSPALFSSRVLCLPLHTVLLAARAERAGLVTVGGGGSVAAALRVLPYDQTRVQIFDIRSNDTTFLQETTDFLQTKNYEVLATFDDGIMYNLKEKPALT